MDQRMDASGTQPPPSAWARWGAVLGAALVLAGLYATSLYRYLLFHSLAEIFSILVAYTIFVFCWNSRRFLEDNYLVLLGIAYLFVGGLDMLHTFAYKGMGIFHTAGSNLATQLWLAARYVESLSLLAAGLLVGRRIRPAWVFGGYAVACTLLAASILVWPVFPTCFVEGGGLTDFKKDSEYAICILLLGALTLMVWRRDKVGKEVFGLVAASILTTVLSELMFTLYVDVYGLANLAGHFLKIISFYLIYRAIVHTGLVAPFSLLFRNLKESERTLGNERALLRSVLEQMPAGVVILEAPSARLLLANRQAEEVWARPFLYPDRPMASTGPKTYYADGRVYAPPDWAPARVLRTGEAVIKEEVVVQRPDGSFGTMLVSAAPVRDGQGRIMAGVSTSSDITQRKRMEEALRRAREELELRVQRRTAELARANEALQAEIVHGKEAEDAMRNSEAKYRTLVEHIPAVTYLASLDPSGAVVYVSPQIEAFLGYSPDQYKADPEVWRRLLHPDDRDRVVDEVEACRRLGEPRSSEYRIRHRDGHELWFRDETRIVRDAAGRPLFLQGTMFDATERKIAEQRIQAYQNDLRSLTSQLSLAEQRERRHIAGALHDHIGQALALSKIKLGAMRVSVQGTDLAQPVDELRELVSQSIDYTRSLIFDLGPPVLYEVGLGAALETLAQTIERQHRIATEFEDDGQPKPLADDLRVVLFQSGRELLMNVVKHAQPSRVKIAVRRQGRDIHVTVEDDGVGFDPGETGRHTHRDGGFGLFSIRERLGHLGGRLDLRSRPGKGTVATLVAPLQLGSEHS